MPWSLLARFAVPNVNRLLGGLHSSPDMSYDFWSINRNGMPVAIPPFALSFSNTALDGHALAAADEDGVVTILDSRRSLKEQMHAPTRASSPVAKFSAHDNAIFDVIWMQNDSLVATASGDATVRVFDVQSSTRKALLKGHSGSAKCIRALPSMPNVLMSTARDGNVRAFDLRVPSVSDRVSREVYHAPIFSIHQPHIPASGHSSMPGTARKRRRVRAEQPKLSHAASVTSLAFYPGQDTMLYTAGAADGTVKLWDLRSLRDAPRTSATAAKHGNLFSVVCVSSVVPGEESRMDEPPRGRRAHGIAHIDIDQQGRYLLVSCTDSTIYLYNAKNLSLGHARALTGHTQTSFYIRACFSPDGQHVLSGSADSKAYIWDVEAPSVNGSVNPILELEGHTGGEASAVDWCRSDSLKLATCADDSSAKVWTVDPNRRAAPPAEPDAAGRAPEERFTEGFARTAKPCIRYSRRSGKGGRGQTNCKLTTSSKSKVKDSDIRTFLKRSNRVKAGNSQATPCNE